MTLLVSLWSRKSGELKRFLEKYYLKKIDMDEDVDKWIYVYRKPLEAVDLISAVTDNSDRYEIDIYIQLGEGEICHVTDENHNDIIKGIFQLFFHEPVVNSTLAVNAACEN